VLVVRWLSGLPRKSKNVGNADKVFDRLQRACAVVLVDRDLRSDPQANSAGAELPLDDTLLPLPVAHAEPMPSAPTMGMLAGAKRLLQRFTNWFKTPLRPVVDRRRSQRFPFGQSNPEVELLAGTAEWPVSVQDISTTGVRFLCGLRYQPGKALRLTVVDNACSRAYPLPARVVRISLQRDGHWATCCDFETALAETELSDLR